jgi:hypothetical protein
MGDEPGKPEKIPPLNGRDPLDFEVAAVEHGRECERKRGRELLKGLLAEYPRDEVPVPRPVSDLPVLR